MDKVTVDAATAAALQTAEPGTPIVDPDGRMIAAVVPPGLLYEVQRMLERRKEILAKDPVTLEELQAADAAGGEYTMDEVMKLLEPKP